MTEIKRKPRRKAAGPSYPDAERVRRNRRSFLTLVGKGVLGASVVGLAGCDWLNGSSGEKMPAGDVVPDEMTLMGVQRPPDAVGTDTAKDTPDFPDLSGVAPGDTRLNLKDTETDEWQLTGDMQPPDTITKDVVEQDWATAGIAPPDIQEPDSCTIGKDVDDDGFPPMPGEAPAPDTVDAKGEVDAWPPLDGDMPAPEEP